MHRPIARILKWQPVTPAIRTISGTWILILEGQTGNDAVAFDRTIVKLNVDDNLPGRLGRT